MDCASLMCAYLNKTGYASQPVNRSRRIAVVDLAAALWPLSVPAGAQVATIPSVVWGHGGSFITGSANNGGSISATTLSHPEGVTVDSSGNIYLADTSNN